MTKENQLMLLNARLQLLRGRGEKNVKCPGVTRKLIRQINKLEKELSI